MVILATMSSLLLLAQTWAREPKTWLTRHGAPSLQVMRQLENNCWQLVKATKPLCSRISCAQKATTPLARWTSRNLTNSTAKGSLLRPKRNTLWRTLRRRGLFARMPLYPLQEKEWTRLSSPSDTSWHSCLKATLKSILSGPPSVDSTPIKTVCSASTSWMDSLPTLACV